MRGNEKIRERAGRGGGGANTIRKRREVMSFQLKS